VFGADPLMAAAPIRHLLWRRVRDNVCRFVENGDWLLVAGRPSYLALHLLERTTPSASCYDAMDDFPEFYRGLSRWLSRRIEGRLVRRVGAVLVSSVALRDKFAANGAVVELLRNGVEGRFPRPRESENQAPVFGYMGTVGAWFDWELIVAMANALPEVAFELSGPVLSAYPVLPTNVRLLGECPEDEVPIRISRFTAGLIPFKINRLTESVDPIKYYEYRAAGLPVISTRFGDVARRGLAQNVYLTDMNTDFRALLESVVQLPLPSLEALNRFRAENSWQSRFEKSPFLTNRLA